MALRAAKSGMKGAPCPRPTALLSRDREERIYDSGATFKGVPTWPCGPPNLG